MEGTERGEWRRYPLSLHAYYWIMTSKSLALRIFLVVIWTLYTWQKNLLYMKWFWVLVNLPIIYLHEHVFFFLSSLSCLPIRNNECNKGQRIVPRVKVTTTLTTTKQITYQTKLSGDQQTGQPPRAWLQKRDDGGLQLSNSGMNTVTSA